MKRICILASALALAGCATTEPRTVLQRINVPVPVECREEAPARPLMPTEALREGVDLDQFAQAAMAEIERREGYEIRLRAALDACRVPLIRGS